MTAFIEQERKLIEKLADTEESFRQWYDHYKILSPRQQAVADYLLTAAKKDSYADDYMGLQLCPVSCADQKNVNNGYGILYAIRRECFTDENIKFCFLRSDMPISSDDTTPPDDAAFLVEEIRRYSSGLAQVQLEKLRYTFDDAENAAYYAVTFRLDPAAVRNAIDMFGERWETQRIGQYILALTDITGEFSYCLGVLEQDEIVPLWEASMYFK